MVCLLPCLQIRRDVHLRRGLKQLSIDLSQHHEDLTLTRRPQLQETDLRAGYVIACRRRGHRADHFLRTSNWVKGLVVTRSSSLSLVRN